MQRGNQLLSHPVAMAFYQGQAGIIFRKGNKRPLLAPRMSQQGLTTRTEDHFFSWFPPSLSCNVSQPNHMTWQESNILDPSMPDPIVAEYDRSNRAVH
eukprot:COSAG02_NODE_25425_length_659_cov_1.085714_1_plen_97_part_10